MLFCCDVGEGQFGERLADADDGFELTDRNGDRGSEIGSAFRLVNPASDGDEMGGELFGSFGGEARSAFSGWTVIL